MKPELIIMTMNSEDKIIVARVLHCDFQRSCPIRDFIDIKNDLKNKRIEEKKDAFSAMIENKNNKKLVSNDYKVDNNDNDENKDSSIIINGKKLVSGICRPDIIDFVTNDLLVTKKPAGKYSIGKQYFNDGRYDSATKQYADILVKGIIKNNLVYFSLINKSDIKVNIQSISKPIAISQPTCNNYIYSNNNNNNKITNQLWLSNKDRPKVFNEKTFPPFEIIKGHPYLDHTDPCFRALGIITTTDINGLKKYSNATLILPDCIITTHQIIPSEEIALHPYTFVEFPLWSKSVALHTQFSLTNKTYSFFTNAELDYTIIGVDMSGISSDLMSRFWCFPLSHTRYTTQSAVVPSHLTDELATNNFFIGFHRNEQKESRSNVVDLNDQLKIPNENNENFNNEQVINQSECRSKFELRSYLLQISPSQSKGCKFIHTMEQQEEISSLLPGSAILNSSFFLIGINSNSSVSIYAKHICNSLSKEIRNNLTTSAVLKWRPNYVLQPEIEVVAESKTNKGNNDSLVMSEEIQTLDPQQKRLRLRCRSEQAIHAVGLIKVERKNRTEIGSGFLIAPHIFVTNHHVIDSIEVAQNPNTSVKFNQFKKSSRHKSSDCEHRFLPHRLFLTDSTLDITIIYCDIHNDEIVDYIPFSRIRLWSIDGVPDNLVELQLERQEITDIHIIGHPLGVNEQRHSKGRFKRKTSLMRGRSIIGTIIHYDNDTLGGMSGSPIFNQHWELIGIHRGSGPVIHSEDCKENQKKSAKLSNQCKFSCSAEYNQGITSTSIYQLLSDHYWLILNKQLTVYRVNSKFNIPSIEDIRYSSSSFFIRQCFASAGLKKCFTKPGEYLNMMEFKADCFFSRYHHHNLFLLSYDSLIMKLNGFSIQNKQGAFYFCNFCSSYGTGEVYTCVEDSCKYFVHPACVIAEMVVDARDVESKKILNGFDQHSNTSSSPLSSLALSSSEEFSNEKGFIDIKQEQCLILSKVSNQYILLLNTIGSEREIESHEHVSKEGQDAIKFQQGEKERESHYEDLLKMNILEDTTRSSNNVSILSSDNTNTTFNSIYHEHPLVQMDSEEFLCNVCYLSSEFSSEMRYRCVECNWDIHSRCFDWEKQYPITAQKINDHIKSIFHSHWLVRKECSYAYNEYRCNVCLCEGTGLSYSCATCEFDLHPECFIAEMFWLQCINIPQSIIVPVLNFSTQEIINGHYTARKMRMKTKTLDIYSTLSQHGYIRFIKAVVSHLCRISNKLKNFPPTFYSTFHSHELNWSERFSGYDDDQYNCLCCQKAGAYVMYECKLCRVAIHPICAIREQKWKDELVRKTEETWPLHQEINEDYENLTNEEKIKFTLKYFILPHDWLLTVCHRFTKRHEISQSVTYITENLSMKPKDNNVECTENWWAGEWFHHGLKKQFENFSPDVSIHGNYELTSSHFMQQKVIPEDQFLIFHPDLEEHLKKKQLDSPIFSSLSYLETEDDNKIFSNRSQYNEEEEKIPKITNDDQKYKYSVNLPRKLILESHHAHPFYLITFGDYPSCPFYFPSELYYTCSLCKESSRAGSVYTCISCRCMLHMQCAQALNNLEENMKAEVCNHFLTIAVNRK